MMESQRLLFLAVVSPLLAVVGCGDDSGSFCNQVKNGLWRIQYTLRAGSDAGCSSPGERTLAIDNSDSSGAPTCDTGCTCSRNSSADECSAEFETSCPAYTQNCTFDFTSTTTLRGLCDVSSNTLDCTVDITGAWESELP